MKGTIPFLCNGYFIRLFCSHILFEMILSYAICNISILPIYKEPSHRAEQVSQLLFGEKAEILLINDNEWAKIRCQWDDYEGWCKVAQLTTVSKKDYRKEDKYLVQGNAGKLIFEHSEMWLPAGAVLTKSKPMLFDETTIFKGKKEQLNQIKTGAETLKTAAMQYLNAPYLWGGRTIAGIDCSGLSQMVFKHCNKLLQRDAAQQANEGVLVDFLQHAQCGDLAFFDNADGRINHVGILLDKENIIHATEVAGRVVVDKIDPAGIISKSLRKRTHNLRMVRRYFDF